MLHQVSRMDGWMGGGSLTSAPPHPWVQEPAPPVAAACALTLSGLGPIRGGGVNLFGSSTLVDA